MDISNPSKVKRKSLFDNCKCISGNLDKEFDDEEFNKCLIIEKAELNEEDIGYIRNEIIN